MLLLQKMEDRAAERAERLSLILQRMDERASTEAAERRREAAERRAAEELREERHTAASELVRKGYGNAHVRWWAGVWPIFVTLRRPSKCSCGKQRRNCQCQRNPGYRTTGTPRYNCQIHDGIIKFLRCYGGQG